MTTNHPLRLAVGSHQAGSGKGCAMNLISWENGDTRITDMPACADPMLAHIVQQVNDRICAHRDGDLLCPSCSIAMLDLAHRTVGTGGVVDLDRRRVWVRIAADQARQVLHLAKSQKATEAAIVAAERWADTPSEENASAAAAAAYAANAAAAYDANAANADAYAAYADAYAAYAAAYAAYADAYADAYAAYAANAANADAADAYAAYAAAYAAATANAADAYAAYAAAYAAATANAYAAANAAQIAAHDAADTADTAACAAYAASSAANAARLQLAHRAIDLFEQLTNHTPQPTPPAHTTAAYTAMTSPRPA